MTGTLFVVATPLGNLDDLSPRALNVLRSVDCIACEDTRRTLRLLARHGIERPRLSCHRFNERQRLEPIIDLLRAGQSVALVSDSGTPGVSDPGSQLVGAALENGIAVSPLPGPSAVATLLSVSGFPADRYVFEGFLPHRGGERRRRLRELRNEERTVVMFEAPHRILATLRDIQEVLGDRPLVLGRELTKVHETILCGSAAELAARLGPRVRGEITLVMAGATVLEQQPVDVGAARILRAWRRELKGAEGDRRAALSAAARELGLKKAELYRMLTELGEETV